MPTDRRTSGAPGSRWTRRAIATRSSAPSVPATSSSDSPGSPEMQTVRIGHSPDADDAFMFYALTAAKASVPGAHIEHVLEDIESLNRRARSAELEVTAVSAATYALVADRYRLMDPGASMGKGYGPILVAREPIPLADVPRKVVAIPGSHTTASLLLRMYVR